MKLTPEQRKQLWTLCQSYFEIEDKLDRSPDWHQKWEDRNKYVPTMDKLYYATMKKFLEVNAKALRAYLKDLP